MKFLRIPFFLLCLATASAVFASDAPPDNNAPPQAMGNGPGDGQQPPPGPPHGHHRPGPPPEALAACKGLSVGASTTMKTPRGDSMQGSYQLVFVPEMKKGGDVPPPPHSEQGQGW